MVWMLCGSGQIRHLKAPAQDGDWGFPMAVCGAQLSQERTDYLSNMMLPQLGFRQCKHCLSWEENNVHS